MGYDILAVTFEVDAQHHADGRFTIPIEVCNILSLKPGDDISLVIETPSGMPMYAGVKKLASGTEIYGADIRDRVKAGQRIKVTASRP